MEFSIVGVSKTMNDRIDGNHRGLQGDHLDWCMKQGWKAMIEELQPLRAKIETLETRLKKRVLARD